jgi:O-antigen ligase
MLLVYNATRHEAQIKWAMILLTIYGWYALYIGYLQYTAILGWEGARDFIWPSYINKPAWGVEPLTYGIHFDRARGAYMMCSPQATLLITLFFADLFLIRKIRGVYRGLLILQAFLVPPAIFFTGVRSGYLAFLVAGTIWCLLADRERFGRGKLAMAVLVLTVTVAMFWGNLTQEDRARGGVAQRGPVFSRLALVELTWTIIREHPLAGVGFGHYLEAQRKLEVSPEVMAQMDIGVSTSHNLFLMMLAETGVVGLLLTVAVLGLLLRESVQLYRKLPPNATGLLSREYVVAFWTLFAAYFVDAMLVDPLWDVASNALFWSSAGLMIGFNRLLEPHPIDLPVDWAGS